MNLSSLSNLHVFSLYAFVHCKAPRNAPPLAVLHDINIVLGTIPESNSVANLGLEFKITLFKDVWIKIELECSMKLSALVAGNLDLELQMVVSTGSLRVGHPREDKLHAQGGTPTRNICTHLRNPTYWTRGLRPFPSPRPSPQEIKAVARPKIIPLAVYSALKLANPESSLIIH